MIKIFRVWGVEQKRYDTRDFLLDDEGNIFFLQKKVSHTKIIWSVWRKFSMMKNGCRRKWNDYINTNYNIRTCNCCDCCDV